MGVIKVRGYAQRKVETDTVQFTIRFSDTFTDVGETIKEVNRNCELFLEKIKEYINIEDIHLDTDSSCDIWSKPKDKNCNRNIYFTTKASPKINNLVNDIIKQNNIKCTVNTNYSISNIKQIHNELLEEAVKDAVSQANIIAAASNCRVSSVEKISYQSDDDYEEVEICSAYCELDAPLGKHHSDRLRNTEHEQYESVYVTFTIV